LGHKPFGKALKFGKFYLPGGGILGVFFLGVFGGGVFLNGNFFKFRAPNLGSRAVIKF